MVRIPSIVSALAAAEDDTSWIGQYGLGSERAFVNITTDPAWNGSLADLKNFALANGPYMPNGPTAGYIRFQMPDPGVRATAIAVVQNNQSSCGFWQTQGSMDAATWTNLGSPTEWGGAGSKLVVAGSYRSTFVFSANAIEFKYYQLLLVSGALSWNPYQQAVWFRTAEAP